MSRWLRRIGVLAAVLVALSFGLAASVAWPGWAFAYSGGTDRLRIHAAIPLPENIDQWAASVMSELDAGPLPPGAGPYDIWITGGGWRDRLFFAPVPQAGGVVYAVIANGNVFLSGANFEDDRLLKGNRVIKAPRTLRYYALHELTHVIQIERLGSMRYFLLPLPIREGMADFIALGPADDALRKAVAEWDSSKRSLKDRLPLIREFGAYPEYRLRFTDALANSDVESLLFDPPPN